jgi:hypothetical protein
VSDYCEGDDLVACRDGRQGERLDCASAGMRCTTNGGSSYCTHTLGDCTPGPATCDGGVLTVCGPDGRVHALDCTASGFTGCGDCAASGMTGCDGAICLPRDRWPWHSAAYAI